ncbi:MAG: hypothetical protein ACI8TQ_001872 [Planctomycetota bacterium]|jgi:hypothetical protein
MGLNDYESKSTGSWIRMIAGLIGVGGLAIAVTHGVAGRPEAFIGLLIVAFAFFVAHFAVLTVRVTEDEVRWFFGGGFIGRRMSIDRVRAVQARLTPWYWGWGIRLTSKGWLWRSHGLQTVWLAFDENKQTGMGTQDPEGLVKAVNQALQARTK